MQAGIPIIMIILFLPEAKRSVLRRVASEVIQLSSGMFSSGLPSGLLWAFGTVHNGFFLETLHNESELMKTQSGTN